MEIRAASRGGHILFDPTRHQIGDDSSGGGVQVQVVGKEAVAVGGGNAVPALAQHVVPQHGHANEAGCLAKVHPRLTRVGA